MLELLEREIAKSLAFLRQGLAQDNSIDEETVNRLSTIGVAGLMLAATASTLWKRHRLRQP